MHDGARKRDIQAEARASIRGVLLLGDARGLLEGLRRGVLEEGLTLVAPGVEGARASLALIAVEAPRGTSALANAVVLVNLHRASLEDDATAIVISRRRAARIAPARLQRLLGPELLFQAESALPAPLRPRISMWTSMRLNAARGALATAGISLARFPVA